MMMNMDGVGGGGVYSIGLKWMPLTSMAMQIFFMNAAITIHLWNQNHYKKKWSKLISIAAKSRGFLFINIILIKKE